MSFLDCSICKKKMSGNSIQVAFSKIILHTILKFTQLLSKQSQKLDSALFIINSLYKSHPHYSQNYLSSKESTHLEGDGGFQRGPVTVCYHISNPNSTSSSSWHIFHPYPPKIYTNVIQTIPKFKQLSFTNPSDRLLLINSYPNYLQHFT